MSTQRREDRNPLTQKMRESGGWSSSPTTKHDRWGPQDHLRAARSMGREERLGSEFPAVLARNIPAIAAGQMAPLETPAMAAMNSLSSDYRVKLHAGHFEPGLPPAGQAATLRPSRQYSFGNLPILPPANSARIHQTLPWVRPALRCRTERYDGKGNLHFKHAS